MLRIASNDLEIRNGVSDLEKPWPPDPLASDWDSALSALRERTATINRQIAAKNYSGAHAVIAEAREVLDELAGYGSRA